MINVNAINKNGDRSTPPYAKGGLGSGRSMASQIHNPSERHRQHGKPGAFKISGDAREGTRPRLESHGAGVLDEDGGWDGEGRDFPGVS